MTSSLCQYISAYGGPLAQAAVAQIQLSPCHSVVFIDPEGDATQLDDLERGGRAKLCDSRDWLYRELAEIAADGLLLVEDDITKPGELGPSDDKAVISAHDRLYHVTPVVSRNAFPQLLTSSYGYFCFGCLLPADAAELYDDRPDLLDTIVSRAQAFLASVYDGESFVLIPRRVGQ